MFAIASKTVEKTHNAQSAKQSNHAACGGTNDRKSHELRSFTDTAHIRLTPRLLNASDWLPAGL